MDALKKRTLLPVVVYTVIKVLVNEVQSCDNGSENFYCKNRQGCPKLPQAITTPKDFTECFPKDEMIDEKCQTNLNLCKGTWIKAGKCGENIKAEETELSLGNLLNCPRMKDLGLYFCQIGGQDLCQNITSATPPVVVRMRGVDTYLATFECVSCKGNTRQPRMQWVQDGMNLSLCSNLTDECSFVLQHLTTVKQPGTVEGYLFIANSSDINEFDQEISVDVYRDSRMLNVIKGTFQPVSFCPAEIIDNGPACNLTFPKTEIGGNVNSSEVCRDGKPRATRYCHGDFIHSSIWADPEVKNCTTEDENDSSLTKVKNLTRKSENTKTPRENLKLGNFRVTKENVYAASRLLVEDTENLQKYDAVRILRVAEGLKNISKTGSSSPEVTRNAIKMVDNIMNVIKDAYEEGITKGVQAMMVRALKTQLTNLHKEATNFTHVSTSLGVATRQLQRSDFEKTITFGGFFSPGEEDGTEQQNGVSVKMGNDKIDSKNFATITLPSSILDAMPTGYNDIIPVSFIIYRTSVLFNSTSSQEQRHRERTDSAVIAATIEGHNIANLSRPVVIRFQLPHRVDEPLEKDNRKCVFWDFTLAEGNGDWSSEGCELVGKSEENADSSFVECHCDHLTNFAVLLDMQGGVQHIALDILSITGCVVSIIALFITIIVLLAVKKFREQVPQKIIINLCFALLGLYICFLVGIDRSSLGVGCTIFSALIHYFCLASVAWMCVTATNMYLLFVRVFNADVAGFMWKAHLTAWGFPVIVVALSVIVNHRNYTKTGSYCFPQADTPTFHYGVLLLVGLMLCYNLVIFVLIIPQVTCGRIGAPAGQDKRTEMIERAQTIIIISVLLGLTWVFGFMSIGGAQFICNLLFLIFNSLQGLFVFFSFILRPRSVRKILFKCLMHSRDGTTESYTVTKGKTVETYNQEDTLGVDDIVGTSSERCIGPSRL